MERSSKYLIFLLFIFTISCNKKSEPDIPNFDASSSGLTCTYSAEARYNIGVDVTTNFSEFNVINTETVSSSTCSDISVGQVASTTIDQISRSGNTITFNNNSSSANLTVVSGNTLSDIPSESGIINGVRVDFTYNSTNLVPATNEITITYTATVHRTSYSTASIEFQSVFSFKKWKR